MLNDYIVLNDNFHLRATKDNYYLSNLVDDKFISEPFQVKKSQYDFLLKLNGEKKLRQVLNDYSKNNHVKVKEFIKKLNKIEAIEYRKTKKVRKFPLPAKEPHLRGVHFEITKKCNLRCLHCYQTKFNTNKDKSLTLNEIKNLAKDMEALNVINISVSGGEPLVSKKLFKVLDIFENHGIKISNIFSNGILLDSKIIRKIKELKSRPHIIISLDGPDFNTHGHIRGIVRKKRRAIFKKILANIKLLNNNKIVVKINTTIHKENINKLIELHDKLANMNIKMWRLAIPKYAGSYIDNSGLLSLNMESAQLEDSYLDLIRHHLSKIKIKKDVIISPFDLRISNTFKTEMLAYPIVKYDLSDSTCEYTRNRISIKHNGDVASCSMLANHSSGNIRSKNLVDIWQSKSMQKLKTLSIGEVKDCNKCKYYSICGAGCRVNSLYKYKNLYSKDEDTCKCFDFFDKVMMEIKKEGFNVKKVSKNSNIKFNNQKYKKIKISNSNYYL